MDSLPGTTGPKGLQWNFVELPLLSGPRLAGRGLPRPGGGTQHPLRWAPSHLQCLPAQDREDGHVRSSQVIYTELRCSQQRQDAGHSSPRPQARCQVPSAQSTCLHSGPSSRPKAGLLGSQPVVSCVLGQTSPVPLSMAGPQRECRPGAFARLWEGLGPVPLRSLSNNLGFLN